MTIKLYKTRATALAAVKRKGFQLVAHEVKYMDAAKSGFYIEFSVDNVEDLNYLHDSGFAAKF